MKTTEHKSFNIINNYFNQDKHSALNFTMAKVSLFYLNHLFKDIECETVYSLLKDSFSLNTTVNVIQFKKSLLHWLHDNQEELKKKKQWKKV